MLLLISLSTSLNLYPMQTESPAHTTNQIFTECSDEPCETIKQGTWSHIAKNLAGSLIIGSVVGSLYGASCAYLERQCHDYLAFTRPISWALFICMKHATLKSIESDAKKCNVACDHATLYASAWISDWIAYSLC